MENELSDLDLSDIVIDNSLIDYTWHTTDTLTITDPDNYDLTITDPDNYDLTIQRPGKPPLKVADTLEKIMERLSIIEPDFDKMEKYPALKEAYNNYKIVEALLTNRELDGES